MNERERYYQMNAGSEAGKAAIEYGVAHDSSDPHTKGVCLKAMTKAFIAQNPKSGLHREVTPARQKRFPFGLNIDFWI